MNKMKQRAHNAMLGLAIGDAISWTALFHRSYLLPQWTRRIRREIDASSETSNVIITPMSFSLNQPVEHFDISPANCTEWAAFSAEILLENDLNNYTQSLLKKWMNLAQSKDPIRGGVSTQAALHNLRNGILPPQSGKENPHYFDDGAMCRAVPIGILCSGDPESVVRLTEIDASVTNSEDGIWAAQAIAVAISMVSAGKTIDEAIHAAYQFLPESSWIRRVVDEALTIAQTRNSIFSIIPELHNTIVNREYSYGNIAPETVALTFAIARVHGNNFETAVMTACGFAKSSETLPAMVGALVGAMQPMEITSDSWFAAIKKLKGISIPTLTGKSYIELVEHLVDFADRKK